MKKIYLVLTYTGTILSRIVRAYTRKKYAHVSIALDEELLQMYSFGRLNAYMPFIGGFVHEGKDWGTFKRFYKTKAYIFEIEVTDKQYDDMKKTIKHFEENKEMYKFNYLGLFMVSLNKRVPRKNRFYCAEFVKYVLDQANVETNLPAIIKPFDFMKLDNQKVVYEGLLREYEVKEKTKNFL